MIKREKKFRKEKLEECKCKEKAKKNAKRLGKERNV